ncbi:hypothetical protein ACJIZ3_025073 [Penstemon smallii]|uniref:RRM domain-containing protein n=1 Tax=Penstemon smallii TaxID=265156 RepID=A0ABD3TTS9_9LAMI
MASVEQPLKKRKLYEPPPPSSPPPSPPPPPPHEPPPQPPATPPPFPQQEILRRRRIQEEIRNVFECYKRIKYCIDQKDKRLMPELEEAYRSLITASRGGASVQRLVAEFVPRYAPYCPSALEAAANVVIYMHNWCFTMITRGEDFDGIAFETTKACILGLVDICQAAASEAPTSAVIQGIKSAVFLNVFNFLASSFEGKDIFQIVNQGILKIYQVTESFSEFKHEFLEEDSSVLLKLSKIRALSFLKIFFSSPKNSLVACFDLFESTEMEWPQKGKYFLHQLTVELNDVGAHHLDEGSDDKSSVVGTKCEGNHLIDRFSASSGDSISKSTAPILKNCLLGLVLDKDLSLKSWIFSRYQTLCDSASSEVISDITTFLERVFASFIQQVKAENSQVDGISGSSKYVIQYSVSRLPGQPESLSVVSGRECPDKFASTHSTNSSTAGIVPIHGGESKSLDFYFGDSGDSSNTRTFMPRESLSRQSFSPRARTPREFKSNSFNGRNHNSQIENSPIPNMDTSVPAHRSSVGPANSPFGSPRYNIRSPHSSSNHALWYSDGDQAAMDIFPASKQLWLGSLGPDASEMQTKFQFEKFGPIDQFRYFPSKGFATIEYRSIMDALKAREIMRGCSPWGACLRIKFLDTGLGTRGAINGTAVGSSCHVYIGNVPSKWAKDEMIHEVKKVIHKAPRMVIDLSSEGALLMEFDSPEEATISISHLRWHRKENSNFIPPPSNSGPANVMMQMHVEGARPASSSVHIDMRNNFSANTMIGSPHTHTLLDNPSDNYLTRASKLSSLVIQLRAKYNINHPHGSVENHTPGTPMREQEAVPTRTLWINVPHISPSCITDDELLAVCNLAINNNGNVVHLSRTNTGTGSYWLVECSSIDTAYTLLKNFRDCPGIFFQIEFSNNGKYNGPTHPVRLENSARELESPRINQENHGPMMRTGHGFQATRTSAGMQEVGRTGPVQQSWMYGTHGPSAAPPQPVPPPFIRPVYAPPNNFWDARGLGHHLPQNPIPSGVTPNNAHPNLHGPPIPSGVTPSNAHPNLHGLPFLPASVTPLAQMQGGSMTPFDQRFSHPIVPPPLSSLPPAPSNIPPPLSSLHQAPSNVPPPLPQFDFRPPLPPHPELQPPLPPTPPPPPPPPPPSNSHPLAFPPPPNSPPPPPPSVSADKDRSKLFQHYSWQGILSKSGVYYCTINAQRVDSDICNYTNSIAEPEEWPAKLDMMKRTDLRHVKSTFSSTPPHRREICWLFPSSHGDNKGFQDFISYLKQRDCAGVIKIPAAKSMWSRLLFILPYSDEMCSMLAIPPNPSLCLIGLILPKESNSETVS